MNLSPRQVLAGLFLICGVALGYSVASSFFKASAQDLPPPPPPVEGLPPENFPATDEAIPMSPQEPALRVVNPEGFIYNPEGLRDPFFPVGRGSTILVQETPDAGKQVVEMEYDPAEPLQSDKLLDYKLVGVLWDVRNPRALIQTPQGRVMTVKKKYRLGREGAVVVAIRESEIVVAEPNPDGTYSNASTRVISMKK